MLSSKNAHGITRAAALCSDIGNCSEIDFSGRMLVS